MLPLFTFATGIVAGAVGVHLLKRTKAPAAVKSFADKARSGLDKAGEELRDATVTGLNVVEKSSASLRAKLAGDAGAPADEAAAAAPSSEPGSTRTNEKA